MTLFLLSHLFFSSHLFYLPREGGIIPSVSHGTAALCEVLVSARVHPSSRLSIRLSSPAAPALLRHFVRPDCSHFPSHQQPDATMVMVSRGRSQVESTSRSRSLLMRNQLFVVIINTHNKVMPGLFTQTRPLSAFVIPLITSKEFKMYFAPSSSIHVWRVNFNIMCKS